MGSRGLDCTVITNIGNNNTSDGSPALPHPGPGKEGGADPAEADQTGHRQNVLQAEFAYSH